MARDPARSWLRFGPHRKLNELGPVQRVVQHPQSRGIDHIFRIVQQDHAEGLARLLLFPAKRAVKRIEAIRLRGRAVSVMNHQPEAWIGPARTPGRLYGPRIVSITADQQAQFRLRPSRKQMGDRGADHLRFLPGRDHHRGLAAQRMMRCLQPVDRRRRGSARELEPRPDRVHGEFVHRADEKKDAREEQQFMFEKRQPFQRRKTPKDRRPPVQPSLAAR